MGQFNMFFCPLDFLQIGSWMHRLDLTPVLFFWQDYRKQSVLLLGGTQYMIISPLVKLCHLCLTEAHSSVDFSLRAHGNNILCVLTR